MKATITFQRKHKGTKNHYIRFYFSDAPKGTDYSVFTNNHLITHITKRVWDSMHDDVSDSSTSADKLPEDVRDHLEKQGIKF